MLDGDENIGSKRYITDQVQSSLTEGKSLIRQIYLQLLLEMYDVRQCSQCGCTFRVSSRLPTDCLNGELMLIHYVCIVRGIVKQRSSYAQVLWTRLLYWLHIQSYSICTWDSHLKWTINNGKGHSKVAQIFRLMYAEAVHAIWMERTQRIFEQKCRDWDIIAREMTCITIFEQVWSKVYYSPSCSSLWGQVLYGYNGFLLLYAFLGPCNYLLRRKT